MTRRPCHICGAPDAAFSIGWPGFKDQHPQAIRDLRRAHAERQATKAAEAAKAGREPVPYRGPAPDALRIERLGGECEAQAIARIERKAGTPYPFTAANAALADRVAEINGRAPRNPRPSPEPTRAEAQGSLL